MKNENSEKAPLFGTWKAWYWAVLIALILEIIVFSLFTNHFS